MVECVEVQVIKPLAKKGNREKVYRLLDDNEDKLSDNFAQLVREDAEVKLIALSIVCRD